VEVGLEAPEEEDRLEVPEVEGRPMGPEEEDRLEVPEVEGRPTDLMKTMERQKAKEKKWEEECPAEEL
jgi:hypothetical protein